MDNIEEVSFEMTQLLHRQLVTGADQFASLLQSSEELVYEEGFYKTGPTIFGLTITEMASSKQHCDIYIPVSAPIPTAELAYVDQIGCDSALHLRVPFNKGIEAGLQAMTQSLQSQGRHYADRVYIALTRVYGEYWADLFIPLEEN
ncbi:MAG: hypothetical protein LKJ69_04835 [Lactobacillus sp.]|jgi:hypothetical protein|nr:hypothetical protein [Lactobacillus sp.]MCI2032709.1 hypothetical protein [Lactobacillus sp.]